MCVWLQSLFSTEIMRKIAIWITYKGTGIGGREGETERGREGEGGRGRKRRRGGREEGEGGGKVYISR